MSAIAVALIKVYRLAVSPLLGANTCRFYPSCSVYAEEAFRRHGFFQGFLLTIKRLVRCHPWHDGGFDPVP